jgi:predicted nucleic acid-binding protein
MSAPELMPYEASNVLRRRALSGALDNTSVALAYEDLIALDIDYFPYHTFAGQTWELRHNLTIYDASYVALAGWLRVPLVTLDSRIARASGPRCSVLAYEGDLVGG